MAKRQFSSEKYVPPAFNLNIDCGTRTNRVTKAVITSCLNHFIPLKCGINSTSLIEVLRHQDNIYIEKVGFTRVYIFFLFLPQNKDCGYSLEPTR